MKKKVTFHISIFLLLIFSLFIYLKKTTFSDPLEGKPKEQANKLTDSDRKHKEENLLSKKLKDGQKELSAFTNWQLIAEDVDGDIKWLNDNNLFFTALDYKLYIEKVHYSFPRSLFMYDLEKRTKTKLFSDDYLPLGGYLWSGVDIEIRVDEYLTDFKTIDGKEAAGDSSLYRKISKFKFSPDRTKIAYMYLEKDNIIINIFDISRIAIFKVYEVPYSGYKGRMEVHWIDDNKLVIVIGGETYEELYIYLLDKDRKSYYRFDNCPVLYISHSGNMVLAYYYCPEEVNRNKLFQIKSGKKILIKSFEFYGKICIWSNNDRYIATADCDVRKAGSCHFKIYDVKEEKIYNIDLPQNDKYCGIDVLFSLKWSPNDSKIALIRNGYTDDLWVFDFGKYIENMEKKGKKKGKKK